MESLGFRDNCCCDQARICFEVLNGEYSHPRNIVQLTQVSAFEYITIIEMDENHMLNSQ